MNNIISKQKYYTPELSITELTVKDVIMASNIEQSRGVVIDDGDWAPTDLVGSILEDIG